MVKAVFFDWFNTLALYYPPREELHRQAMQEFGIEVSSEAVMRGVFAGDKYFWEENILSPIGKRSPEEQTDFYFRYQEIVLNEAGVKVDREKLFKIMDRAHQLFKGVTFILFDDALAVLKTLKERKLILGLLTNATKKIVSVYRKLGLEPYLDFVVTSDEVGSDKPDPHIFLAALEQAKVNASEAVYVGDQYAVDVVGARGVGISPILLDRYDFYPEVTDCPRIHTLPELVEYI